MLFIKNTGYNRKSELIEFCAENNVFKDDKYFIYVGFNLLGDKKYNINIEGQIDSKSALEVFLKEFDDKMQFIGKDLSIISKVLKIKPDMQCVEYEHFYWYKSVLVPSAYKTKHEYLSKINFSAMW